MPPHRPSTNSSGQAIQFIPDGFWGAGAPVAVGRLAGVDEGDSTVLSLAGVDEGASALLSFSGGTATITVLTTVTTTGVLLGRGVRLGTGVRVGVLLTAGVAVGDSVGGGVKVKSGSEFPRLSRASWALLL